MFFSGHHRLDFNEIFIDVSIIYKSCFSFTILYLILYWFLFSKMFPLVKKQMNIFRGSNAIASMFHCIGFLVLAAHYEEVITLSLNNDDFATLTTKDHKFIFRYSLGYFIYDTLSYFYYQYVIENKIDYQLLMHHIVSIIFLLLCLCSINGGHGMLYGFCLLELSNPWLHTSSIRRFALRFNNDTFTDFIVHLLFVGSFIVFRVIIGGYYFYQIFLYNSPYVLKWEAIVLMTLSISFLPRMCKFMLKTRHKYLTKEKNRGK
eukprot:UN10662